MAKQTTINVTVYNVKRAASSNLGNPRYAFHTDHGRFRTAPNLGASYGLENEFRIGETLDVNVTLTLDGYGNVTDWTVA